MRTIYLILSLVFISFHSNAAGVVPDNPQAKAAYKEIEETFGMVPTFLKEFPQESISGAWQEMRDVQLNPTTALTPKSKELIGLAVASQIPCAYCVYFHKAAAKFNGATDREMKYAIAVAAETRKWSTFFYGAQVPMDKFKSDVKRMVSFVKSRKDKPMTESAATPLIGDVNGVMKDIEKTFGFVPEFAKQYSTKGLPGSWNELKMLSMNPRAPLSPATINLIGLAVSAQAPCPYCTLFNTEFAKLDGATTEQIHEAIAMAGVTRHWSTFLNGLQQPQKDFENEVNQIFKRLEMKKGQLDKSISKVETPQATEIE
ncbi:MAG: carboxymuconolactone decarboxylase family protein [Bdellovibrio sp.]